MAQVGTFVEKDFKELAGIPDNIHIRLPISDEEVLGFVPAGEVAVRSSAFFTGGLRLPFTNWVASFFEAVQIAPAQLALNGYRTLNGIQRLSELSGIPIELKDVFGVYSLSFERRSSYLKTLRAFCRLVIGLPDTNKERNLGIVIASGEWGCAGHQIPGPATNAPTMPDLGAPNVEALLALWKWWGPGPTPDPASRTAPMLLGYPMGSVTKGNPAPEIPKEPEEEFLKVVRARSAARLGKKLVRSKRHASDPVGGVTKRARGTDTSVTEEADIVGSGEGAVAAAEGDTAEDASAPGEVCVYVL